MNHKTLIIFISLLFTVFLSISLVLSTPVPPSINYISNSTMATTPALRSYDAKGTITVLNLDALQQDYWWKAYVGNASGKLTLDDANSYTIYDWTLGMVTGEIYITRNNSINWDAINCSNQTVIDIEESFLTMTGSAVDSISSTFNETTHKPFLAGTRNMTECRSLATFVNDTRQTFSQDAYFQEVLLADDAAKMVYASVITPDTVGYNNETWDFQALIGENAGSNTPNTYYFFLELG